MVATGDKWSVLTPTTFPDGTVQVWNIDETLFGKEASNKGVIVLWTFESHTELFALAQLKMLLDSLEVYAELHINYLPYARQDKHVSNSETFGLHAFAKLLNSIDFHVVYILDPHSDVATRLINNSQAYYLERQVERIIQGQAIDYICYPDAGAKTKYSKLYNHKSIYANKLRDSQTGDILELDLIGLDEPGKRVLIVDDICDGGATFVRLAKALRDKGASYVGLYVSYALMTKGDELLFDAGIEDIYQAVDLRSNRNEQKTISRTTV
jgi:ribose-phosphate pyrophosphokinase